MNYTINININQVNNYLNEKKEENKEDTAIKYLENRFKEDERQSKFAFLKSKNEELAKTFNQLEYKKKSIDVTECSSYLEILYNLNKSKFTVKSINSCKNRFCFVCMWRKSLKQYTITRKIYNQLVCTSKNNKFLFLTLTTKNVKLDNLQNGLDEMMQGLKKLYKNKDFKNLALGTVKNIEFTVDRNKYISDELFRKKREYFIKRGLYIGDNNSNYLMVNIHTHILVHTTNTSFYKNYLSNNNLALMWQKALNVDYKPQVDIRLIKNKKDLGHEIAEVVKYSVKPNELIVENDTELNKIILKEFIKVLHKRRLFSFTGTFKDIKKELLLNEDDFTEIEDIEEKDIFILLRYVYNYNDKEYYILTRHLYEDNKAEIIEMFINLLKERLKE